MNINRRLLTGTTPRLLLSAPSHDFRFAYGCYESAQVRVDVLVDDDVAAYADFSEEEVVWAIPHTPQSVKDSEKQAYEFAKAATAHCYSVLDKAKKADPGALLRRGTGRDTVQF